MSPFFTEDNYSEDSTSMFNGTPGVNYSTQVQNEAVGTGAGANTGVETGQNTADFSNALNESLREQMMQSVMDQVTNRIGGMNGFGGTNAMLGGLNGLGGINPMLSGMGGLGGTNAMMGGFMPSATAGLENTLISAAATDEMSGAQLMLFMMIMMMQSGDGGGDMAPMMQMMAGMLSNFSEDVSSGRQSNMTRLGDMQGGTPAAVKRMVDVALSKVGYHESNEDGSHGNGNFSKFGAWYGMNGQPWCAMFVSWAADQAGILNSVVPKHAYTPTGANAYMQKGLYAPRESGYIPREGDAVYFYSKAKGRIGHVGIVVAYDPESQRVYTVEGNTSNAVRIRHYDIKSTYIHGYGKNGGTSFGTIPNHSSSGLRANTD